MSNCKDARPGLGIILCCALVACAFLWKRQMPAGSRSPVIAGNIEIRAAIEIQTATAGQLQLLPGIGAKLSRRIVAYRELSGGFNSLEALKNVRGIGDVSIGRITPWIRDGGSQDRTHDW